MIDWIKRHLGMVVTPSIDHLTTYRAKVVAQSSDKLTVDVVADDPRIGMASKVPILLGLPDCTVAVTVGCFVRLGWRGGDPRQPYVTSWESGGSVTELKIHGGTKGAARVDDGVTGGTLYFVAGTGGASLTYVEPGGAVPPSGTPVALTGFKIAAGSSVVKVG
jgi:hypothetical protein